MKNPNDPKELDRRDGLSAREILYVAASLSFIEARNKYSRAHGFEKLQKAWSFYQAAEKSLGVNRRNALERRLSEMSKLILGELAELEKVQGTRRRRKNQRMFKTE